MAQPFNFCRQQLSPAEFSQCGPVGPNAPASWLCLSHHPRLQNEATAVVAPFSVTFESSFHTLCAPSLTPTRAHTACIQSHSDSKREVRRLCCPNKTRKGATKARFSAAHQGVAHDKRVWVKKVSEPSDYVHKPVRQVESRW